MIVVKSTVHAALPLATARSELVGGGRRVVMEDLQQPVLLVRQSVRYSLSLTVGGGSCSLGSKCTRSTLVI